MKIIGLSGTNGSGKDTVGKILADEHNYLFISVTDLLRDELRVRNLPIDRENLRNLSAEWRREYGLGVLIDKAVEYYNAQSDEFSGLAVASLRNPGEADKVHELGGLVIWVDADPKIRYERVQTNAHLRDRAEEDNKTFEEFLAEEQAEMKHSGDEATLSMADVKAKSDKTLLNEGKDLQAFKQDVAKVLGLN